MIAASVQKVTVVTPQTVIKTVMALQMVMRSLIVAEYAQVDFQAMRQTVI